MDEELQEPVSPTRWLARAVAGLLVAGAVWVAVPDDPSESTDHLTVTAAGEMAGGVDALTVPPTTIGLPPATVLAAPTTAAAPSTSPTTRPPRTTTTADAAPSTTAAPTTSTTVKKAPDTATVVLANEYPHTVAVTVNGRRVELAAGEQAAPFDVTLAPNGNDVVEMRIVAVPTCGAAEVGGMFPGPGRYRVAIVDGLGICLADPSRPFPAPSVIVTRS